MNMQASCFIFVILVLAGCGKTENPRPIKVVVYSLDPIERADESSPDFHGFTIIGKTQIVKQSIIDRVLSTVSADIAAGRDDMFHCFEPRHGVRVQYESNVVDYVICYECLNVRIIASEGTGEKLVTCMSKSKKVLNDILKEANVRLAAEMPSNGGM